MKLTYPPQEIDVEKRNDGTLILSSPIKLELPTVTVSLLFESITDDCLPNLSANTIPT